VYGYEIQKWLEISHTELWADVLPGSIYHALRQMEKELAQWGEGEQAKREAITFPIFLQAVFDNGREHLEANIRLVQRLLKLGGHNLTILSGDVLTQFSASYQGLGCCLGKRPFLETSKQFYQQTVKGNLSIVSQTRSRNQSLIYLFFYRLMGRFENYE